VTAIVELRAGARGGGVTAIVELRAGARAEAA